MRMLAKVVWPALLCVPLTAGAQGVEETGLASMPCAGALAWLAAHPDASGQAAGARDAARSLTEPALAAELKARVDKDQEARRAWIANRASRPAQRAVNQVDADDVKWLYTLVTTKGLPTVAQVGEWGVHRTWLLAQHADNQPTFQAELMPAFERSHTAGELSASDLARFTDRVLVKQGKPQRYGTQFTPEQWDGPHFGLPDDDAVRQIDDNRRALGTMPLADYVCMMRYARRAP